MAQPRLGRVWVGEAKRSPLPPNRTGGSPAYGRRGLLCEIPGLKRKALGRIRLADDMIRDAELHWYQAHRNGRKEIRVKHLAEQALE